MKLHWSSQREKKEVWINVWPPDPLSASVQDFFDAPAAEQEIQALLHRLDEAVSKVAAQEVLASPQTHSHVPKMLSQSGGGHGLGKGALRVHGRARKPRSDLWLDLCCGWARLWLPLPSRFLLLITSYRNRPTPPFMSCFFSIAPCFETTAD